MKKIGCISIIYNQPHDRFNEKLVAIDCAKGRGIIFPGGKWIPGETFKEAAARELLEETGLVAQQQKLIYQGMDDNKFYCYAFLTTIKEFKPIDSLEGKVVLATWPELLQSKFRGYYELLKEKLEQ